MYRLELSQSQEITFVMIDAAGNEVAGLGNTFILELRKPGGAFVGSAGVKAEIGNGWYSYVTTAAETDTVGPLSVRVTGAGCVQQNLEYVVETRAISAIEFTYTVTDSVTLLPIEGVQVWIATDLAGANIVWSGDTDALGIARDDLGALPRLDPGAYFFFRQKSGYTFVDPDTEIVS